MRKAGVAVGEDGTLRALASARLFLAVSDHTGNERMRIKENKTQPIRTWDCGQNPTVSSSFPSLLNACPSGGLFLSRYHCFDFFKLYQTNRSDALIPQLSLWPWPQPQNQRARISPTPASPFCGSVPVCRESGNLVAASELKSRHRCTRATNCNPFQERSCPAWLYRLEFISAVRGCDLPSR